jgi:small subunit ribosomal protein S7
MPRRRVAAKWEILPDPKFGSVTLAKFMNHVMVAARSPLPKKSCMARWTIVEERMKRDPLESVRGALANIAPLVEVKSRRVGGATYQVPVEVRSSRRNALSMRWLVEYARARGEKSMASALPAKSSMRPRVAARREEA